MKINKLFIIMVWWYVEIFEHRFRLVLSDFAIFCLVFVGPNYSILGYLFDWLVKISGIALFSYVIILKTFLTKKRVLKFILLI